LLKGEGSTAGDISTKKKHPAHINHHAKINMSQEAEWHTESISLPEELLALNSPSLSPFFISSIQSRSCDEWWNRGEKSI
jgi:hypothetical protein